MLNPVAKLGLIAFAVVFAVSSCSRTVDGHASMAHPGSAPGPGAGHGAGPAASSIEWGRCTSPSLPTDRMPAGAQCGQLDVPIDYGKPESGVATIALIRFRATGDKIGSLLINPGGPGVSAVGFVAGIVSTLPAQVRERFDIVGFDPRGVGSSKPAVWCNSDADNDRDRTDPQVDYSPAGVARIEQQTKEFVQRCIDKTGTDFLANVGTGNVAKDMDRIRAALGENKLNYVGFSYGTELGGAYAEAFPQNVRAMVLDGAVDPTVDPMDRVVLQAKAFQAAFDDYATDCAKSPDCPLGTDPAKAVDVFHSLVDPLVDKPARTSDPRGLSYPDAITGTVFALYSPSFWKYMTKGLQELKDGDDADDLLTLADEYWERGPDGKYTNSSDANIAINCVDDAYPKDPQAWADQDKRLREVAPFMSYGEFTGHAPRAECAFWPVPATGHPHPLSAPGLPPVLVISSTGDPATPYENGVHLAEQLHGTLLTVEGTQHTAAFGGDECVDAIVTRHLVETKLPPPDTRCAG
ncbi:MAG TPA: alpha/beta hydrolase [Mycobacterium sp.]|jgi:pimeloyl-ACP methyl ester carboxylesterase